MGMATLRGGSTAAAGEVDGAALHMCVRAIDSKCAICVHVCVCVCVRVCACACACMRAGVSVSACARRR